MKTNQRTIKVYDHTHRIASRLSNRFGISMAALVDVLLHRSQDLQTLDLPARDPRYKKINARRLVLA